MTELRSHNYIFGEGGGGIRVLLAAYHWLNTKAMAEGSESVENYQLVFETMDAGGEEIGEIKSLQELSRQIGTFGDVSEKCPFTFVKLAESVADLAGKTQEELRLENGIRLRDILPEWFQNELLLSEEQLNRDISGGYHRDQTIGCIVVPVSFACALQTPEDKKHGFGAVIEDVVASNGNWEVRVVMAGTGWGGEGISNLCTHPANLKELCILRVMEKLKMDPQAAKAYVEKVLKIGVIMTGAAYRYPSKDSMSLNENIAGLVAGTLESYPDDSAEAVNLFYLLEHDGCPVQASKASNMGIQYKKSHAIELVAVAMLEDFFHRTTEQVSKKQCPVIPHYSLPGNGFTNWTSLGLPGKYRELLSARLRFDTALFYWVAPQLLVTSRERNAGKLYQSELLHQMYNERRDSKLKDAINSGEKWDLDEDILKPLQALLIRERMFLNFLLEISQTGKNWETDNPASGCGTSLFPVEKLEALLKPINEMSVVRQFGGMTKCCLDEMTQCPEGPAGTRTEDNIYTTGLTLDRLRKRVCRNRKIRESLTELLKTVYEVSSAK